MDTRDTPEQAELRRAARQLARDLGPHTVAGLDDTGRVQRLRDAVRDAGWIELRDDTGDGTPIASGVEAAIVADALGAAVADVAFAGPVLARDLARRAGVAGTGRSVVACTSDLTGVAVIDGDTTTTPLYAVDGDGGTGHAFAVVSTGDGFRLAEVAIDAMAPATDLTRTVTAIAPGTPVRVVEGARMLTADDLVAWESLGCALTSADLVGLMHGVLDVSVAYAAERKQYGVAVGSFQAVQHLLAEARCLVEGARSAALHASWAVDDRDPVEARQAGRVAKAYSARAARTVCETAVQVHGGIGNTWECIVHVYLRRAVLSSQWFGDDAVHLRELQRERLGVA